MANAKEIVYLRGKAYWFKALGDPVDNYNKDGKEWIFDLSLDDDGVKQVKSIKVQGKTAFNLKDKDDERGQFVTLKQRAERRDGTPNKPIRVMDANGREWNQNKKLGNGSDIDVKIEVIDFGKGMFAGVYPRAVRVLNPIEYQSQEFEPLSEDDEFYSKAQEYTQSPEEDAQFKRDFGGHTADLDDDIDDVLD